MISDRDHLSATEGPEGEGVNMNGLQLRVVNQDGRPEGDETGEFAAALQFAMYLDRTHDEAVCGRHRVQARFVGPWNNCATPEAIEEPS